MESESYLQGSSESHGQEVAVLRFTRCQMSLNLCHLNHSPNWKSGRSRLKSPAMCVYTFAWFGGEWWEGVCLTN